MSGKLSPKTYEEHLDLMLQCVRVMLAFSWHHARKHSGEDIVNIIESSTEIPLLLPFRDEGSPRERSRRRTQWSELIDEIRGLREKHHGDLNQFEKKALAILEPHVRSHSRKHFKESRAMPRWCADSLKFDETPPPNNKKWFPDQCGFRPPSGTLTTWCCFHIRNALAPQSLFDDPTYLPACFMKMMTLAEALGQDTLFTGSWLNSYDRWLDIFPTGWRENLGEPDARVAGDSGYWGQLINSRGAFNEKTGAYIRETGRLRFPLRMSYCSFDAMRAHLSERFPKFASAAPAV